MPEDDARPRQREAAGGVDVFAPALDQRRAADGSRVIGPLHADERDHHLVDAFAENGHQNERDQDGGKRQLNIDEPHQTGIDRPAEISGDHAERRANHEGDAGGHDADEQAQAQAVENGGQHVTTLVIGPQQKQVAGEAARARGELVVHDRQLREIVGILR